MTVVTETQPDATAIRPFTLGAADADLQVQLGAIQALARYRETEDDSRKCEARPDEQVELVRTWIADGVPA